MFVSTFLEAQHRLLVLILLLVFSCAFAQAPDTLWTQSYGAESEDEFNSVDQTTDGGYILTGYTGSYGAGMYDVFIVKTDEVGDMLWYKTYGGENHDYGNMIRQTADGGYIIAGKTASFGAGSNDIWLLKTDSMGDTLWTRLYGGVAGDVAFSVEEISDSGYIVVGMTHSFGAGSNDMWLLRTDSMGDTLWTRTYGGVYSDEGRSVQPTADGGYIVVGKTRSFGSGKFDCWLLKLDANGDTLWTKTYGDTSDNEARSVRQTPNGGYIMAGKTWHELYDDLYVVRTDSVGNTAWEWRDGSHGFDDGARSVALGHYGGYVVVGYRFGYTGEWDMYAVKLDDNGDAVWEEFYGGLGADMGNDVQQTSDDCYVFAGRIRHNYPGQSDAYLVKTEPDVVPLPVPSAPNISEVLKDLIDINLTWNQVTSDTSGDPDTADHYVIYRDTNPNYVPGTGDSIGYCDYPETTYVDLNALQDTNHYYYIVKAVSIYNEKSKRSNVGYKFNKFFNENPTSTDKNWTSLPWHNNYGTVSDLTDDLSASGDPLVKITRLRDDQYYESWLWDDLFMEWTGANYPIDTGRAYSLITIKDTSLFLVGSNKPDGLVWLNENATTTDKNWVSTPYNAAYGTVSDITDEYSPNGNPLTKITNRRDSQYFESWLWDDVFLEWYGVNFIIEPGRGYEFVTIVDTIWNPTEYSNEPSKGFYDHHRKREERVVTHVGTALATDRAPVSISDVGKVQSNRVSTEHSSHIVRCHIRDTDDVVFTAYRPTWPYDVLTEKMIGCGIAQKNDITAIWFDCGNFKTPWQDGEEVILVVEALQDGQTCCNVLSCVLDQTVDIQDLGMIDLAQGRQSRPDKEIPLDYAFSIEPNPFVEDVQLNYAIPQQSHVEIIVYDISGRRIRTLHATVAQPGYYAAHWDGTDEIGRSVSAGVYILRFKTDDFTSTKKVVLLR